MTTTPPREQLPPLPADLASDDGPIWAAIRAIDTTETDDGCDAACEALDTIIADAMQAYAREALRAQVERLQAAQVVAQAGGADERARIESIARAHGTGGWQTLDDMVRFGLAVRAALADQPARVAMPFDLICQAIKKADDITMEADYMLDSDDCIRVVRVMQALIETVGITTGDGRVPTLNCKKCHADRAKEGCRNQYRDCPFTGTAQPAKDTP